MLTSARISSLHLIAAVFVAASTGLLFATELEQQFAKPPDTARPWVYWTCQDGYYSIEGATADLEAMQQVGIGGILRMDCHVMPYGGTPYLGEQWLKHFVHTVHECERLGLEFATITGPGWTGTGGPWINVDQSMQHLVPATVTVQGPSTFDQVLALPEPRISRYHRQQTPEMSKAIQDFYRDVAVLAFPHRPPLIEDIQEKALFIRNPFTSMKGVRPRLPSPADYASVPGDHVIDPGAILDLTDRLQADGTLAWDVPPGAWTIVRLVVRSTGANTRPAPAAGLGLESNKFSKQALATHFEAFFDPLLEAIGPRPKDRKTGFVVLDADSWEMSSQNWTPGFREAFRKQCGYDPLPYFAAYTGCVVGSREMTERFLWDVRDVCRELLLENHAAELRTLSHQRGLKLMMEPYDMNPAGDLDLGSYADYPAGEFWFDTFQSGWSCIEAASIAHVMGKPVVLAEAFTSIGNWRRTPWVLKNQTDWAFAAGINKFSFHGFAHQSSEDHPGMTFGPYGVFWNRKQTFWPLLGAYHEYLARCSHLLQQGVTVSDVLYLTPEGVPQVFLAPSSALTEAGSRLPDKKGYGFDGCSPRILMNRAEVRDGKITFPGGTSYHLLVLPNWNTMTPELLAKIKDLVEAGATVIGSPPQTSPSLAGYPACDQRVQQLSEELWGPRPTAERKIGKGRVLLNPDAKAARSGQAPLVDVAPWHLTGNRPVPPLYPRYEVTAAVLAARGLPEDFQSDGPLRYAHRRTETKDIYFVSNRSGDAVQTRCTFRVDRGRPELWNPRTGERRKLPNYKHEDGRTEIPMAFEALESFFVVFPRSESAAGQPATGSENFPQARNVATLDGSWTVSFDPRWGGPSVAEALEGKPGTVTFDHLQDWTRRPEEGIQHYSGIATYRKVFDVPEVDGRVYLDLGRVHELAEVTLNGQSLGVAWCAPWRVEMTGALKKKGNRLDIRVANLWANRMIGDAGKPEPERLTRTALNKTFYKASDSLLPSGLLGPVHVMVVPQ